MLHNIYGAHFLIYSEEKRARYLSLAHCYITLYQYYKFDALQQIKSMDRFASMCRKVGMDKFMNMQYLACRELTLEFYTTLK